MESINSTDYASTLEGLLLDNVNEIRKSAIIQHLGNKMATASSIASELSEPFNADGYSFDSSVPEGSTFSLHV